MFAPIVHRTLRRRSARFLVDKLARRLNIEDLLRFEASADGSSVALVAVDSSREPVALDFTTACLSRLMLTLPRMINAAVQKRGNDPGLRVVYPLEGLTIEIAADRQTRILTLKTPDGFGISFTADPDKFDEVYEVIERHAVDDI